MKKSLNDYVKIYKEALDQGDIQIAYHQLLNYVMALKVTFQKEKADSYTFANVQLGFMDYTYFYFSSDFLRSKKLRFAIVLNHPKMQFELWLLGQNASIQDHYWDLLKTSKWNVDLKSRPTFSILEAVVVEQPDFNDLDALSTNIIGKALQTIDEILPLL